MLLIHGTRYFTIQSFWPAELDLFGKCDPGIQFLRQQEYFHLFFIPVFGTGKRWMVRHANGQIGFVPPEFVHHLKSYNKIVRSPWYTFIGLFAAIIILTTAIFLFAKRVNEHDAKNKKEYEQAYAGLKEKISKADENDLFEIAIIRNEILYRLLMRLVEIRNDSLILEYNNENIWSGAGNYSRGCRFYYQVIDSSAKAEIHLARKDALEAITPQSGIYTVKKLHRQIIDGSDCQITITNIHLLDDLRFILKSYGDQSEGEPEIELIYEEGFPGKIIQIEQEKDGTAWKLDGDSALICDQYFRFYSDSENKSTDMKLTFVFQNTDSVQYRVFADPKISYELKITRLN